MTINLDGEQFEEYSNKLTGFLETEKGMLLKPKEFAQDKQDNCLFETVSGNYLPTFITLWPLFQKKSKFDDCIEALTDAIKQILKTKSFSHIIACTPTSRFILDHLHQTIESFGNQTQLHYLGNHPFLNLETREILDFDGDNVLIITDVICTGKQVENISSIVNKTGGHVIGVLSVYMTGTFENGLIKTSGNKSIRAYSLCHYPVKTTTDSKNISKNRLIKINPETVYPEQQVANIPHKALFNTIEMNQHFDESRCITFGFFEVDNRRFTSAIRYQNLFDAFGDEIWSKIANQFTNSVIGISTFDIEDIYFKNFVIKKSPDTEFTLIPKEVNLETSNNFFLLPNNKLKLKHAHVVLLFGTVSSTEKLRHLATLLASHEVAKITVLCTLNRMGAQTTEFIKRINNILRGLSEENVTEFEFKSLYNLPDINSGDLTKMQQKVATLFNHYKNSTQVSVFRRWMKQDEKYFKTRDITSLKFHASSPQILPEEELLDDMKFNTLDGKLAYLCSQLVAKRDYKRLINQIEDAFEKDTLFSIFGILLSDLNYLKLTSGFGYFKTKLLAEIKSYQRLRIDWEEELTVEQIDDIVETETWLMFGLALISYLDQDTDNDDEIINTLTCGLTPEKWLETPKNLIVYFSNERVFYCTSLFIHFSYKDFNQSDSARPLKQKLNQTCDKYLEAAKLVSEESLILSHDDSTAIARFSTEVIKRNFNFIKSETGEYKTREYHDTLRYLHSKIIYTKSNHSEILTNLNKMLNNLKADRQRQINETPNLIETDQYAISSYDKQENQQRHSKQARRKTNRTWTEKLKNSIEDALVTIGVLEDIAQAANELCSFASFPNKLRDRFMQDETDQGFYKDIVLLGNALQKIRRSNQFHSKDLELLQNSINTIKTDLWKASKKSLYELTSYYIVNFHDSLLLAATEADKELLASKVHSNWVNHVQSAASQDNRLRTTLVLIDPFLLREAIKNMFTNIKHSSHTDEVQNSKLVVTLPETNISNLVQVNIYTFGSDLKLKQQQPDEQNSETKSAIKPFCTIDQHKQEIQRFGGELKLENLTEQRGVCAKLKLIHRNPYSRKEDKQ